MNGPWRFQPGPCVKPALVRPHTGPRSGRRRGCLCPPTHPPIAAAYCACCAVLLLRLPTAVLLSCYSYPQSLRRDGVEFILRVGLTTSRARERRGNIYIYIMSIHFSICVYICYKWSFSICIYIYCEISLSYCCLTMGVSIIICIWCVAALLLTPWY